MKTPTFFNLPTLAVCLLLSFCESSHAGLIVTIDDQKLISGSIPIQTTMDVYLDLTDADDGGSFDVANFQVRVELLSTTGGAGTDVSIIGVFESTSLEHPQAATLDLPTEFDSTGGFGNTFSVSPITINDGAGLMSVLLEIQPNVVGEYTLQIVPGNGNTELIDPNDFATRLAYSTIDGTLSVVPEPSSLLPSALLSLAMAGFWIRRRRPAGYN